MKKAVAFDLGKVVFDFDYDIAFKRLKNNNKTFNEIMYKLCFEGLGRDYEAGDISSEKFYEIIKDYTGTDTPYDEFRKIWAEIFSLKHDTMDLIKDLKSKKVPLYLISNICEIHWDFLYKNFPDVFSHFDGLIASYKHSAVKPEKKIYEDLKKMAGKKQQDIIYFDDRHDLIYAAGLLEFDARLFTNAADAQLYLASTLF